MASFQARAVRAINRLAPILAVVATSGFLAGASETEGAMEACRVAPGEIQSSLDGWTALVRGDSGVGEAELDDRTGALVEQTFAFDVIAGHVLGRDLASLDPHRRVEFRRALARRLGRDLMDLLAESSPRLTGVPARTERDGPFVRVPYVLGDPDGASHAVWVAEQTEGPCRIGDLRGRGRGMVRKLRELVDEGRSDYSWPQMIAFLGDYDHVVLEDFERTPEGSLPTDWTWRSGDDDKNKPYAVVVENGNRFLQARDRGESVILGREVPWDVNAYPYVSFRVRVWRVPPGGDERYDDLVDSAAGVYFTLNTKVFGKIPESVKYVWSSTLPVGAAVRREGIGKPWQVVFGSGTEGVGEWRTYVFDVRQAYRDTFGGDPPRKTEGVGVLSDANSLDSEAWADYDDFRALRTAPASVTSGVHQIMPPLGRKNPRN